MSREECLPDENPAEFCQHQDMMNSAAYVACRAF